MAKAKAEESKKLAPRTIPLPGTEDERLEEVSAAAAEYQDAKERRMKLTEREVEKQRELLALMKEHKLKRYFDREAGLLVEVVMTEEKAKVYRRTDDDPEPKRKRERDE